MKPVTGAERTGLGPPEFVEKGRMAKRLHVGNLSYDTTEESLREVFEEYGPVESVTVVMDRTSGRSKGFGFVEYADDASAQKAIDALNGREVEGRAITVAPARPREERTGPMGGGGGGRYGGGRGY